MVKTNRTHKLSNNKTKKIGNKALICPIGLKSFEAEFSKGKTRSELMKNSRLRNKEFIKQLLSSFAPNSIKPTDDYYDYINYQWLKNVSLEKQQKYIVQVDDFRLTQDKVYRQLNEIILEYIRTHKDKLATNLKNFYGSVIKMNPPTYSRKLAKEAEQIIDKFISEKNPWNLLAFINSDEMISSRAPFVWTITPDEKNPEKYCSYIYPHSFTLVDTSVYIDDGTSLAYKARYKKAFKKYCQNVFNTTLGHNNYNAEDILNVETEMIYSFVCKGVKDDESGYIKVYADEALSKYGFDWHQFTKALGYKTTPKFFVSSSLAYLKCCSEILVKNWDTPKWRTYWIWILLQRLIRITPGWEKITYDFFGKFERGQEALNTSDSVSSSLYMSVPFNTFLTNQYVAKYENPQLIEYVKTLCNDLKIVYRRILERNTWMEPSTKAYALKKMDNFKFVIGKPEGLREDPDLDYGHLLYDNMKKIMKWRHDRFVELDGEGIIDIPMMDWTQYPVKMTGSQAYIVNASYTPAKNSIYINLGYIQKPFVDLEERGIEYNLAHIGDTLGHEMSHGFDDSGSKYGLDGTLYDWWTPEDKKKYKAKQEDVIKQYEEFAARDGLKFDASISIGEDLADISAIAICGEYLRDFQDKNNDIIPIRTYSFEAYYTYYAFQQRQLVKKKALKAQLKSNPHPLDKYRCNVPLSRSEIFRALFNVKKGDGMWWHNTDTIW
jgi:putative endopeptidase